VKLEEAARVATELDAEPILTLARGALAELSNQRGGAVWSRRDARVEPIDDAIAEAIAVSAAGGPQLVAVGTLDDVVVGYAVVRAEEVADGGHLGVIEDLYVEPPARGVGVGEALMNLILAWATEHGCFGVDSIALPGDRGTKNFFESFGLVARKIAVHRALPTAGDDSAS
jgi:GNAT superfamily N-acetyltransferase